MARTSPAPALTQARLREVLHYRSETGVFRWKITKGSTAKQGKIAGTISSDTGYKLIRVDGSLYAAHRLAWLYVFGRWPAHLIDHINMDRSDNRLTNLRETTVSENRANRTAHANNLSGYKGVSRNPPGWMARIKFQGRTIHLGTFASPEEAHAAYAAAAPIYHGAFARTSR